MHSPSQIVLSLDWFTSEEAAGVDFSLPGIYVWSIEGVGTDVGKYTDVNRPRRHYGNIVRRLLDAQPYWKSKPEKFRKIHHALADAVKNGSRITLTILENPSADALSAREQELIRKIAH